MHKKLINSGWIEVICGGMFSGKTEELLRRIRRAQIANMSTIIFKPQIDTRYSKNKIVSHNNNSMESEIIQKTKDIFNIGKNNDVVGIDEAQFFDSELLDICKKLDIHGVEINTGKYCDAKKNNISYNVTEPNKKEFVIKSYADNFLKD